MLDSALAWLNLGVAVVPQKYGGKKPIAPWGVYRHRLPDEAELRQWFGNGRRYNLAVVTGWRGLAALDFDNPQNYYQWLMTMGRGIGQTYQVLSSKGMHVYYFIREKTSYVNLHAGRKESPGRCALPDAHGPSACEVKAGGVLITVPPSMHGSGRRYEVLSDKPILTVDSLADVLPASLVKFARPLACSHNDPWSLESEYTPPDLSRPALSESEILALFPNARPKNSERRFWEIDCPEHGHKANAWVDAKSGLRGCWAGCERVRVNRQETS